MQDCDIGLTEKGNQQAIAAGEKLRSIIGNETMYVYMSPYLRSRQTWENIKKAFPSSQIISERRDPRIRELELGNTDNAQNLTKEVEQQKRTKRFYYRFSGGESGADVYDRASLFLDTLIHEMDNGYHDHTQNIVIVSHGFFITLFLMRYFRWNVEDLKALDRMDNCAMRILKKVDGVYTLDGKKNPSTESS
jgi:broad specificity phosphatase PhoE